MDGNLGIAAPAGPAVREIGGGGGEVAPLGCTGGGEGGGGGSAEAESMTIDSTSTEWTDEKHSLYLNSIEESFVNQLYSHGFSSNNLFGWTSRTQKDPNSLVSRLEYSGQFKVLHGGCWGEVKFERPRFQADIQNETRVLSRNPWIQHFCSASTDKRVDSLSSDHLGRDHTTGQATVGRQCNGKADCGEESSLNQRPAYYFTRLCHQDSVVSTTEVSDQNFVDDFEGAKRSSRVCKKKRSRTAFSDTRDQVVPFGKTTAISSVGENSLSLQGNDAECSSTKSAKFG